MIALVFCGDIKYCPYITRYIERLEKAGLNYTVYFWNRSNFSLNLSSKYVYYNHNSDLKKSKVQKLFDFIRFRKWLIQHLDRNQYERIIALSTLSGVLLGDYLYGRKGKYIFDIRDYSYEHIMPFYLIEKKVIENSAFTAISSAGFKEFLPIHEYVIAHNFNRNDIGSQYKFVKSDKRINVVWNGLMRYFDFQKKYLDALKNDPRFNVVYHGDGPELEKYKEYCKANGFENVQFTGAYVNSDKEKLLLEANILNNCYGYLHGAGKKLKHAVSNKFYDGITYHIPQLVEPEGFKSQWVCESGLGVSYPPDKEFADKIYNYYQNINADTFNDICVNELKKIIIEDDVYISKIDSFIANCIIESKDLMTGGL